MNAMISGHQHSDVAQWFNENYFLSEGSLFWRVKCNDDQHHHHHYVVSLESIFLSSRKSNQGSKKNKNHQNFTANPLSSFPNSWIECKCLKKGENVSSPKHANVEDSFVLQFCSVSHACHLALKLNKLLIDLENSLQPRHMATFRKTTIFPLNFHTNFCPRQPYTMFHLHPMALK